MEKVAIFVGIFVALILSFLPLMLFGKQWMEKARARRIADAEMNARLLRFDI